MCATPSNRLASPLLCPTLRVRLDHVSLDFVDNVAESSLIAEGVHKIEVVVDYRPRELATDLLRFGRRRRNDLIHPVRECCMYEMEEIKANDMDHETVSDYPYSDYQQTTEYCQKMIVAWNKYVRAPDKEEMDATTLEFIQLFRKGHQEYIQKHEEQFQLITDGSFVGKLTSAMSRMRHCASFQFVSDIDCYSMLENANPLTFRDDEREALRLMTSPLSWHHINHLQGGAKILPAKLLWELPIALHEAGLTIQAISICTFPHPSSCPMDYPAPWTNLFAACQHLKIFGLESIMVNGSSEPFDHLLGKEQDLIEQYVGVVLSSEVLEVIRLSFQDFSEGTVLPHVGSLPQAINWPRIRKLRISHVSLSQEEHEVFCSGLGYMVENIDFHDINLQGGSWAGVLDMLRERVPKRRQKHTLPLFYQLTGGEFGWENEILLKSRGIISLTLE